jgi:3-oxoacyl-[acyl-carrier protein] reductase
MTSRRAVLITGASRGLGRATALAFGRAGWGVVVNAVRSADAAAETARAVAELGGDALVAMADVTDPSRHQSLIDAALHRWDRLDALVNNAAIALDRPLPRFPESDWDRTVATDLLGAMALARCGSAAMLEHGSILNVISMCGMWGCPGSAAYSAAKGALAAFTQAAAAEFAIRHVRVNALAPGYLATDLGRRSAAMMTAARNAHPMHTLSDPAAAADLIVRLSTMPFVNGQVITLDGRIR